MEILTDIQETALRVISQQVDSEAFYLTGGTALSAFYLNHRKSLDLDFFTSVAELITPFSLNIEAALKAKGLFVERRRGFHSFVELIVRTPDDSTQIHLAADSPFRFEQPAQVRDFPRLLVDSLVDIASNKLLALFGRAALRDFIDVFFLARDRFNKEFLTEKAVRKDPGFDLYWLGVAFERIHGFADDSPDMHLLVRPCGMKELKMFFDDWRRDISRGLAGEGA